MNAQEAKQATYAILAGALGKSRARPRQANEWIDNNIDELTRAIWTCDPNGDLSKLDSSAAPYDVTTALSKIEIPYDVRRMLQSLIDKVAAHHQAVVWAAKVQNRISREEDLQLFRSWILKSGGWGWSVPNRKDYGVMEEKTLGQVMTRIEEQYPLADKLVKEGPPVVEVYILVPTFRAKPDAFHILGWHRDYNQGWRCAHDGEPLKSSCIADMFQ